MKVSTLFVASIALVPALAYPTWWKKRDIDPSLIPDLGWVAGVNPTGTGDCQGAPGTNVEIPCSCPPPNDILLQDINANLAAGHCVNNTAVSFSFPTDDSIQSQIARINGVIVTMQNLKGPGVGCPAAATTLVAARAKLQAALDAGETVVPASPAPAPTSSSSAASQASSTPAPAPFKQNPAPAPVNNDSGSCGNAAPASVESSSSSTPAAAAPTTATPAATATAAANSAAASSNNNSGLPTPDQVAALAPDLGHVAGTDPVGNGNCAGAIPGGPQIPCDCPPDRPTFLAALEKNIAAGEVVNNPGTTVKFPTDNSLQSQQTRLFAAIDTLQSLNGPGKGCPAASTTLSAQLAAVQAQL